MTPAGSGLQHTDRAGPRGERPLLRCGWCRTGKHNFLVRPRLPLDLPHTTALPPQGPKGAAGKPGKPGEAGLPGLPGVDVSVPALSLRPPCPPPLPSPEPSPTPLWAWTSSSPGPGVKVNCCSLAGPALAFIPELSLALASRGQSLPTVEVKVLPAPAYLGTNTHYPGPFEPQPLVTRCSRPGPKITGLRPGWDCWARQLQQRLQALGSHWLPPRPPEALGPCGQWMASTARCPARGSSRPLWTRFS